MALCPGGCDLLMRPVLLELEELRNKILEMGGMVEASIHNSIRSLVEQNRSLATEITASEARVNEFDIQIDELALRLFALHQPVARDLRFVTAAIKINSNLERMGDLAVNIARLSLSRLDSPLNGGLADIPRMSKTVESMVRNSLDAFVRQDETLARSVLLSDDAVDGLKEASYRELLGLLKSGAIPATQAFDLIFIAHHLERVADHATNIAEMVLFMVTGLDVRHHHLDSTAG